jgi:hypothetical protein
MISPRKCSKQLTGTVVARTPLRRPDLDQTHAPPVCVATNSQRGGIEAALPVCTRPYRRPALPDGYALSLCR